MAESFLETLGKSFVPRFIRPSLRSYLEKAGISKVPYTYFGGMFFVTVAITFIIYAGGVFLRFAGEPWYVLLFVTFITWFFIHLFLNILLMAISYFYLNIRIYKRTKLIEEKLPDYLTVVSTNLKGGMSFDKSLWSAIRPEFGVLAKEIIIVSKKVATGNDTIEALQDFSKKYNSPTLRRAIDLIIGEIRAGGEIVTVLDDVIRQLRKTKELKEEMASATVTYMIFLGAIVIVIAPALFALSYQLLQIITQFTAKLAGSAGIQSSALPVNFSEISIRGEDYKLFSILSLSVISITTSMIISTIEKGDVRAGLRLIPMFLFSSVFLYFVFTILLGAIFSGIQI